MTKSLEQQLTEAQNRIKLLEAVIKAVTDLLANARLYEAAQAAQEEQPIKWVEVVEVERDQFYSKTSGGYRPMWRLKTSDGRKVNLFDHSDPLRDQSPLLKESDYDFVFRPMSNGQIDRWTASPICVDLVADGSFWKVIKIKPRADGASPDFTGDSDTDDKEPYRPRPSRMFYPQGSIDLKDQLWEMNKAKGAYDDALGNAENDYTASNLIRLIRVVTRGNFVVLDTETTGLGTDAEICQIAIVSPTGEKLLDTLIKPRRPIPSDATRIHGITNDMVKTAPDWLNTNEQVWQLLKGRDVITYNSEYDFRLIVQSEKACKPFALSDWNTMKWVCAMEAYSEHVGEWDDYHAGYRWHKLQAASAAAGYGLPADVKAHSAFGDCLMTLAVCRYLVDQAQ